MTFGNFKEKDTDKNLNDSILTEDSLRLALSKLGSKSEQSASSETPSFPAGNARTSHPQIRRKFVKEDSVVVEKLPSSRTSQNRALLSGKIRTNGTEKVAVRPLPRDFQDMQRQLLEMKEKFKASEERQRSLEKKLAETQQSFQKQERVLSKYKEQISALKSLIASVDFSKRGQNLPAEEDENIRPWMAEPDGGPEPLQIKEDGAPIEWWKI